MSSEQMTKEAEQVPISSWSEQQLVESADRTQSDRSVRCPDCQQSISNSHGGQPLPGGLDYDHTFGLR